MNSQSVPTLASLSREHGPHIDARVQYGPSDMELHLRRLLIEHGPTPFRDYIRHKLGPKYPMQIGQAGLDRLDRAEDMFPGKGERDDSLFLVAARLRDCQEESLPAVYNDLSLVPAENFYPQPHDSKYTSSEMPVFTYEMDDVWCASQVTRRIFYETYRWWFNLPVTVPAVVQTYSDGQLDVLYPMLPAGRDIVTCSCRKNILGNVRETDEDSPKSHLGFPLCEHEIAACMHLYHGTVQFNPKAIDEPSLFNIV